MKNTVSKVLDAFFPPPQQEAPRIVPPQINTKKCTGCGLCVKECGAFVLEMRDGKVAYTDDGGYGCVECGHCVAICPAKAIKDTLAERGDNRAYVPDSLPSAAALQTLFRSRRSVRVYRDKPLSREVLERLLEAGRYSPCGGNRPDVHFTVLSSQEEVARLRGPALESVKRMFAMMDNRMVSAFASLTMGGNETVETIKYYKPILEDWERRWIEQGNDRLFFNAPAVIFAHGAKWDETIAWSCAIALHQIALMGHVMKVGSCYNGIIQLAINRDAKIKQMIALPPSHKCYGAMMVGYPRYKNHRFPTRRQPKIDWRL